MKKLFILCALLAALVSGPAAQAAGTRPADMTASGAIVGSQLLWCPIGTASDNKCTFTQVDTFINAQFSGDATVNSTGTVTLKNTGPGATGPIGSTTVIPVVTIDAQGRVTALGSATAAATVSSISAGCGTSTGGSPITTTGTVAAAITTRVNSTTSDTIVSTDCGNLVQENNASSIAVAIAQAGTAGFANGAFFPVCNKGAGTATITPATSTIGGASTYALPGGTAAAPVCITIVSDGTNYNVIPDWMANASLFTAGTVPIARLPTGTSGGNLPLMNGNNTWSGTQTFGATVGTVTTQSGTTYTLASTDCGTTVRFTNASAVTVTIPQGLAVGCVIAIEQAAAGAVSVNGSAVTPATLHSAHSYTKTSAQWAVIGIFTESSNVAILTGDGA